VSKTTIAQAIARLKNWDLVYITPSDFISGGESAIEQKAKLIFDTLSKMSEVVVFFDEIDRLLLDRDSKGYGHQGDIFQFMTPGMLAKLTELRKVKSLGFIIATNYADRIDRAIKREGRIDKALLCLPPNKAARKKLIMGFIADRVGTIAWKSEYEGPLESISQNTACYGYEEIKSFVNKNFSSTANLDEALQQMAAGRFKRPEISVGSYDKRLKDEDYTQRPWEELMGLRILLSEGNVQAEGDVVEQLKTILKNQSLGIEDILSLATSCGLNRVASTLKQDTPV
jgi:hypothetical protein